MAQEPCYCPAEYETTRLLFIDIGFGSGETCDFHAAESNPWFSQLGFDSKYTNPVFEYRYCQFGNIWGHTGLPCQFGESSSKVYSVAVNDDIQCTDYKKKQSSMA
mmetsp:Transcript_18137/g.31221  ORF Transcript_18137/g.31221 Transcript_18137/m.31221 type:complete len:105 (-) Transcript_18137:1209-1523(-)